MTPPAEPTTVEFECNGQQVQVPDDGSILLDALRDRLGLVSVKDGCSPQGQCGCCTVLVDGQPRVSCVTPTRRIRGRSVTTAEGLDKSVSDRWANAFTAVGASQCGFCTPGIIVRLAGLEAKKANPAHRDVHQGLAAHLCRCTGWNTIVEAWDLATSETPVDLGASRDLAAAAQRATIEGGAPQLVSSAVARGEGRFADDTAPDDALVALRSASGDWVVGESMHEARALTGKVQGRRTTLDVHHPIPVPEGEWDATLQTTWVEPGYLETDASWCAPGGEPATPLANGGAFGAKQTAELGEVARKLADEHGRPVRVLFSREDAVQLGPKRPPVAGGARANGEATIHVARTAGIAEAIRSVSDAIEVVEIDLDGPPTSAAIRSAGWAEAIVLLAGARGEVDVVTAPGGGRAEASIEDGCISVRVEAGEVLDEVVLRSYCIGAAHMAWSWVTSEALSVDEAGVVHDLTVRSFGIVRSSDMPEVRVEIVPGTSSAVNGSDAVFAAVASATWLDRGVPGTWPTR